MDHLLVRLGRRTILLADVHRSTDGHGIGYGTLLIRTRRAFQFGQLARVPVLCVPWKRALNTAVTQLHSDELTVIRPESWVGRSLTVLWYLAAPFRIGDPILWMKRSIARLVVGPFYEAVERSTRLPRRVRRFIMRQDALYGKLKAVNAAYAVKSEALWQHAYSDQALARLRAIEEAGQSVRPLCLRIPAERERQVAREAAGLGLDPSARLVTVHVRESGYRQRAGLRQRGWDDIRNARIESFFPAFATLVGRGYTVVRLGDPTMTPVDLPGVVDLATSPARNQWLDIWCTMRSEFLIGCDSGPSWLAMLLDVPILTVNAVHFRDLSRPADRITCKLARDTTTGETLSVSEMLTDEFLRVGFKGDRYDCVDNSPADLRRAVLDMIEVVHGRERRSSWQNRFNRLLHAAERQGLGGRSALDGVVINGRARGTLSHGFAKKHFVRERTPRVEQTPRTLGG
ncbi:MAG TPA: TIGR04372 family glycosyltransferase [Vicinamibacterales bacterium]|nr:TIGR04372 family glycosyltransferase [Vicinamibacterales bacterium]